MGTASAAAKRVSLALLPPSAACSWRSASAPTEASCWWAAYRPRWASRASSFKTAAAWPSRSCRERRLGFRIGCQSCGRLPPPLPASMQRPSQRLWRAKRRCSTLSAALRKRGMWRGSTCRMCCRRCGCAERRSAASRTCKARRMLPTQTPCGRPWSSGGAWWSDTWLDPGTGMPDLQTPALQVCQFGCWDDNHRPRHAVGVAVLFIAFTCDGQAGHGKSRNRFRRAG
mmetsp:Transcript_34413/g.89394  ORF Transcript_34413/g.89394 Transcript_34413/m.89394 type:complete len:228 (+) Transcript_34413:342-1025(+)